MTLFLSWKLDRRPDSAQRAQARVTQGERLGLYLLRSFSAAEGEAEAYLEPRNDLEMILESVYDDPTDLLSSRWHEKGVSLDFG